jgi:putative transposase
VVERVQEALGVSQRRACQAIGQPRSTQRYVGDRPDQDKPLVAAMLKKAGRHPRYGYRRITALLRREGWRVNKKRVHRLWVAHGLKVPARQRKKRRLGLEDSGCPHYQAEHKDHVWCYDFVQDKTEDGKMLRFLVVVDEYTRECLALEVDRSFKAVEVTETLRWLFTVRGVPKHIRSDNGSEFIAKVVKLFLAVSRVKTLYIDPGSPWQNGYCESFNSRLKDELLRREIFTSLRQTQVLADRYKRDYNERRPHSSLGYKTPAEFAAACVPSGFAALRPSEHTPENTNVTLISSGT